MSKDPNRFIFITYDSDGVDQRCNNTLQGALMEIDTEYYTYFDPKMGDDELQYIMIYSRIEPDPDEEETENLNEAYYADYGDVAYTIREQKVGA